MRNLLIFASLAAIAVPSLANAEIRCRDSRGNETAATVVGAIAGGLVGNAVSHGRDRGLATAAGAVGGALLGNSLASSSEERRCPEGYTAYEYNTPGDPYGRDQAYSSGYQPQPTYSYDAYGRRIQTYAAPQYQTYGQQPAYGDQAYSDDRYRQPAPREENRAYDRSYSSSSYDQGGTTWQDSYGRTCRWRDRADAYGTHSWVQVCR